MMHTILAKIWPEQPTYEVIILKSCDAFWKMGTEIIKRREESTDLQEHMLEPLLSLVVVFGLRLWGDSIKPNSYNNKSPFCQAARPKQFYHGVAKSLQDRVIPIPKWFGTIEQLLRQGPVSHTRLIKAQYIDNNFLTQSKHILYIYIY